MKRKTNDQFIDQANTVHSGRYDYRYTTYMNNYEKVKIVCPQHGPFEQKPNHHLNGHGCPKCGGTNKSNTEEFIERASKVHDGRYSYHLVSYKSSCDKVLITCANHGPFQQTPAAHLSGQGCPQCGADRSGFKSRTTLSSFIEKATIKHGVKYDYTSSIYNTKHTKMLIICPVHGDFYQTPDNHLSGCGCPGCAKTGFDKTKSGYVYFLLSHEGVKVGVTNRIKNRIKQLKRNTPFQFVIIQIIKTDGKRCSDLESYYKQKYKSAKLKGFDGCTEWLCHNEELMNEIYSVT